MSRGPGHVEHAIRNAFQARPDHAFTTEELCRIAYPEDTKREITRAHRVVALRAAKNIAKTEIEWRSTWSLSRGHEAIWFNVTSVDSYALACALRCFDCDRKKAAKSLKPGGQFHGRIVEGGEWRNDVESFRQEIDAIRAGDKKRLKAVLEEREAERQRRLKRLQSGSSRPDDGSSAPG
jgi:hypothetical protein